MIDNTAGFSRTKQGYILLLSCLILITTYSIIYYFVGSKLQANGGLGWDGVIYGEYVMHFWDFLKASQDSYHMKRILPSFIIYFISHIAHLNVNTPQKVFLAFYVYNSLLFVAITFLWHEICSIKKINSSSYLIGLIAIFVNIFYLYFTHYCPVLTDVTALFFGFLCLYFYINKKFILLAVAGILSNFAWPITLITLAPLFFYTDTGRYVPIKKIYSCIGAILLTCLIISPICYLTYGLNFPTSFPGVATGDPIDYHKLPLSLLILGIYVFSILYYSQILNLLNNFGKVQIKNIFIYGSAFLVFLLLLHFLKKQSMNYSHLSEIFTIKEFLVYISLGSIAKPALFIVSHIFYFGPIWILLLLFLKECFTEANQESFGMLLFLLGSLFLFFGPESRQFLFNYPFIIYLVCKVTNKYKTTLLKTILFLLISLMIFRPEFLRVYYNMSTLFFCSLGTLLWGFGYNRLKSVTYATTFSAGLSSK